MSRADLEGIKYQGLAAMKFVAEAAREIELLRDIALAAYADNQIYIENRHFLKTEDSEIWRKKSKLIEDLKKWKAAHDIP